MRKILLSFAALCCMVTTAFSAVGDKVYFVNNASIDPVYVGEANESWTWVAGANATAENWQYNGKDVYSYVITDANATRIYVTNPNDNSWIKCGLDGRFVNGCYYTIDTDNTNYWLTENYYNEFYFMDNNAGSILETTPNIALAKSDWTYLNGTWEGQPMTSIGNFKKSDNTYAAWKYIYLTSEPVELVQFLKSTDTSVKLGQEQALVAGKNYYSWWGWHTLQEVADCIQLVGDADICGTGWGDDEENVMWWDGTNNIYSVTRKNVHVTTDGDYKFRVYPGFGTDNWNARFPHANSSDWHESIHLAPGIYSLYFVYNPATDALTCTPTACYTRQVTNGNYGTICLPNTPTSVTGATLYTIAGTVNEGAAIELLEVTWDLEAGRPYIFQASADWLTVNLDASTYENAWENYNGLHGSYYEYDITADGDNYILSNNQFKVAGAGCKVGAYRAYLDMSNINPAPAHIQGRRYVRLSVEGQNAPTSIESLDAVTGNCSKVIRDGQLIIIRDGKAYNAMGTIVK